MRRVLAVALCGALAMPALATDPVRTCPCRAHKLNPTVLRLWGFASIKARTYTKLFDLRFLTYPLLFLVPFCYPADLQ